MPRPIYAVVVDRLKTHYALEGSTISDDSRFADDLGLDSLDVVEFLMDIEDEFGIEISDSDLGEVNTVKDFCEFVHRQHPALTLR